MSAAAEGKSLGAARVLGVALLCVLALLDVGANFVPLVWPSSHFGFSLEGGRVVSVVAGMPAQRAGIRAGDRLALERLSPLERDRLLSGTYRPPGTRVAFTFERGGRSREIVLTSEAQVPAAGAWLTALAQLLETLIFVVTGAALVLLRPALVTWGFLLLATGYPIVSFGSFDRLLPASWHDAYVAFVGVMLTATIWGGAVFTARFPDGKPDRFGRLYERYALVAAPLCGGLVAAANLSGLTALRTPVLEVYQIIVIVTLLAAIAVSVLRWPARAADRARTQWVFVGSGIGLGAVALNLVLHELRLPGFNGSTLDIVLPLALVLLPLTVAYAVLRHRVIDVRFALNRALVYGFFTSGLVVAFSLVEFLVGKLESGRVAQYVELALALAIGFSFNLLHKRLEDAFERFFFRRQHEAEQRLHRVAAAIPHAQSPETVDDFLTREPAEAFGLASAALFRRTDEGDFRRTASRGWPPGSLEALPAADPLFAYLAAERDVLGLERLHWDAPALPPGRERPFVAVPIAAHNLLAGVVFFGERASGETLDPDERALLRELAAAAAAAYDHLDAEAMRREVGELRVSLDALRPAGRTFSR
jgi:GAF domain